MGEASPDAYGTETKPVGDPAGTTVVVMPYGQLRQGIVNVTVTVITETGWVSTLTPDGQVGQRTVTVTTEGC